jgi:hypothetical protein
MTRKSYITSSLLFAALCSLPSINNGQQAEPQSSATPVATEHRATETPGVVGMIVSMLNTPLDRLRAACPLEDADLSDNILNPTASARRPVVVVRIVPGSPAAVKNIQVGDRILAVGSTPVDGLGIDAVVKLIHGAIGQEETITLETWELGQPTQRKVAVKPVAQDDLKLGGIGIKFDQLNTPLKAIAAGIPNGTSAQQRSHIENIAVEAYELAVQSTERAQSAKAKATGDTSVKEPTQTEEDAARLETGLNFYFPRASEISPFVVEQLIHGGPAEKAGVQAGDEIVFVNGETTYGMREDDCLKALKGGIGKDVTITVKRLVDNQYVQKEFTIKRVSLLDLAAKVEKPLVVKASLSNLDEKIRESKLPVVVSYQDPNEVSSQLQELIVENFAKEFAGWVTVIQVEGNLTSFEWSEAAQIVSLPTIRYLQPGKGEVDSAQGPIGTLDLEAFARKNIAIDEAEQRIPLPPAPPLPPPYQEEK